MHAKQVHFKVRIVLELLNCGTMSVRLLLRIVMSLSPLLNHTCARLTSTSLVLPTLLTYLVHTHLSRLNKYLTFLSLSFHSLCLFILLVFSSNLPCLCFLSLFLVLVSCLCFLSLFLVFVSCLVVSTLHGT